MEKSDQVGCPCSAPVMLNEELKEILMKKDCSMTVTFLYCFPFPFYRNSILAKKHDNAPLK